MDPLVRLTFRFGVSCHWRRVSHKKKYLKKIIWNFWIFFYKKEVLFPSPPFLFLFLSNEKKWKIFSTLPTMRHFISRSFSWIFLHFFVLSSFLFRPAFPSSSLASFLFSSHFFILCPSRPNFDATFCFVCLFVCFFSLERTVDVFGPKVSIFTTPEVVFYRVFILSFLWASVIISILDFGFAGVGRRWLNCFHGISSSPATVTEFLLVFFFSFVE